MLPVILLVGIRGGVMTPTEASAAAAAYALLISVALYRSVGWGDLYRALLASARTTASIGMLIAAALVFNYVVTVENIPQSLSVLLTSWELSPIGFLILVNVVLLLLGCVLEGTTILLVVVPVLIPTAQALGDRHGAFRRRGGRQHHDRPHHAALRTAALHHDPDRRSAAEGHRARRAAVPVGDDRRAGADHLLPRIWCSGCRACSATRDDMR